MHHRFFFLDIEVDQAQSIKFATEIARGMAYVHGIKPNLPKLNLSPRHILVSTELLLIFCNKLV